jgi:hypothetical protein
MCGKRADLEEQRIGMMYLNVLRRRIADAWDGLFPRGLRRSPLLPFFILAALIVIPTGGWLLHTRGKFHSFKTSIDGDQSQKETPRPGGAEAIVLHAPAAAASGDPTFVSATILPGVGMNVLQITANLPGRGEVPLLKAPSLEAMADGSAGPRSSADDMRGAIELPWAGGLTGQVSLVGTTLMLNWGGHAFEVPNEAEGQAGVSRGGLLSRRGADASYTAQNNTFAGGSFHATDFDGHWPGQTETSVTVELHRTTIDLKVTAKNTGLQPEPMGIGWHPRFAIPSGVRSSALLQIPESAMLEVMNRAKDTVSGHRLPLSEDLRGFLNRPAPLADSTVDAILVRPAGHATGETPRVASASA